MNGAIQNYISEEIKTQCIGKKLTGIYLQPITDSKVDKQWKRIHQSRVFSNVFYLEFEDALISFGNDYILAKDELILGDEEKQNLFCGNEVFSDWIGRELTSIKYSMFLSEYMDAYVPDFSVEIELGEDATIRLRSVEYANRINENIGNLIDARLFLKSTYRTEMLKVLLEAKLSQEELSKIAEPMEGLKQSEAEVYAKNYLIEHGYIKED